jgi:uncharacterized protein YbgA (DUF1722 family)/uncharacterized protein YbbK (DUF523 family)
MTRADPTPKIGVSACLLGHKVRYDGGDKRDFFLTDSLGRYVRWIPVCPELEVGMGVPREPVRLVGSVSNPLMIGEQSAKDWTRTVRRFTARKVRDLEALGISGYIFKSHSPSCGMERVPVYRSKAITPRQGRGLFAAGLMRKMTSLPVEEEGRLHDPQVRENFIERVFAYQRWQELARRHKSVGLLVDFHTRHKLLLLAHSEPHYRRMGRLVAAAKRLSINNAYDQYGQLFMAALAVHASVRKHCNVLEHMAGYFSQHLPPEEYRELNELIRDFRRRMIPLTVPLTAMRRYVKKYRIPYLQDQIYLEPNPKELMLRHHV